MGASITVRPVSAEERVEESEAEEFEEDVEVERRGEDVERFEAEDEGEFIRKINDPRLPSKEEIERHRIGRHVEFRDWCDMCVKARSRDMPHRREKVKRERCLSTVGITVFLGMSLDTNGQCWWEAKGRPRL